MTSRAMTHLGAFEKAAPKICNVGNDRENNYEHKQRDYLNRVIDGARDKPITDRSQREMQRHAFRRLNYQGFVGSDDG